MGLRKTSIPIQMEWVELEEVFQHFCNTRKVEGNIYGRKLSSIEIENRIQFYSELPNSKNEIPKVVGYFEIEKENIEFSIFDKTMNLGYVESFNSQASIEFIEILKDFK
ncbi:MAG: hypothetical protein P1U56_08170 [Saprospiraceae bacterium]|nr:hypothetical protein [Saprospiraceae bacterium]